ncbi:MAG: RagB/SusD family nutrient uptake outer membrane protein [Rikenellaceae bacterium]|jgi:tetratricopeptide (TPR) repeat protein|nr:RagB/SusD family nutrient uptake outer membrane protein [Rikenellaceae bacterium]
MKRTVYIFATFAIFAAFALVSCREFLEPKSQSEFIPSTAEQLNEMLISALPEPNDASNSALTGGFLDILSDDVETTPYIDPRNLSADQWYQQSYVSAIYSMYTWQPDYSVYQQNRGYAGAGDIYKSIYKKLIYVNAALDYVDRVTGVETLKNYVRAQARTLRAFYYMQLVNIYGAPYSLDPDGPGIPLRTTAARENRKMERNTVGEVYDLIVSDLRTAVELFSSLEASQQYRQYRPTLPMALLLLSRTYLYMENWEQAAICAQKLISEWPRFQIKDLNELVDIGITNVHHDAAVTSDPDVRRTQKFYNFVSYDNPDVIWIYGPASNMATLTRKTLSLGGGTNIRVQNNNVYACLTSASLDLASSYDSTDLRLRTYLVRNLFYEPDYDLKPYADTIKKRYHAFGKMNIQDTGTGVPSISGNRFLPEENIRTFGQALRITEAYLILAEAQSMLGGQEAQALTTLQHVWSKRFAGGAPPASYTSGSDVKELVRRERRREMCFEALRWFDLRRWDRPRIVHEWCDVTGYGDLQRFVLEHDDRGYTLSIPHTILSANPDLTQAPLYNDGRPRQPQQ